MSKKKVCDHCQGTKVRMALHRGTQELHKVKCACTYELPIKFVYQQPSGTKPMHTTGCCVAAVAMIVGRSYFEVQQRLNVEHDLGCDGLYTHQVDDLLDVFGFAVRRRTKVMSRLQTARPAWPVEPWADLHFCEVLNTRASGTHAVVLLRDGRVLDPWWGVLQGLHRYPEIYSMAAVYQVEKVKP